MAANRRRQVMAENVDGERQLTGAINFEDCDFAKRVVAVRGRNGRAQQGTKSVHALDHKVRTPDGSRQL